jgi:hypothetical protein
MGTKIEDIPEEVKELFSVLTYELIKRGWNHYSADAVLHRIRWHYHVEKGNREFKCNDHWTASLARWWLANNQNHPEFFELRALAHERGRESNDMDLNAMFHTQPDFFEDA